MGSALEDLWLRGQGLGVGVQVFGLLGFWSSGASSWGLGLSWAVRKTQ